jgi:hypothetical protein
VAGRADGLAARSTLAGIEPDLVREKYPSLRFSEEVLYMVHVLCRRLRALSPQQSGREAAIAKRVLGLLFRRPMQKVWDSHELYLYPYLSKTKLLPLVVQGIGQIHKTNINNAVKTFGAFISGTPAFPERGEGDKAGGWLSTLNGRLGEYASQRHPQLL